MPYPKDHKQKTRARIVEAARQLFNTHGYDRVTIDMVMERAGLTRGGFYAHFTSKEALFAAAVDSFLMGQGAEWRARAGVDPHACHQIMAERMIAGYLSAAHLGELEAQCPLIALSSDVARSSPEVRAAYSKLLSEMVWLFEANLGGTTPAARDRAMAIAALCVGGMILARTLPDSDLADNVRVAARDMALAACAGDAGAAA
ncbi:TetR/AcrR family transcriptional regulator [Celeribacter arenosi]|uniref:TetR/AcrR family transcriptional regulator n=1 Tax=Celeribacter arenosi TaxID=792649 RepID=A0ABP7K2G9_9RHOB